jgi:hypothetical protein
MRAGGGGARSLHASPPFMIPSVRLGLGFFSARAPRTHSPRDGKCTSWHSDQTFAAAKSPSTCVCMCGAGFVHAQIFRELAVEYVIVSQEVISINTCLCLQRQLSGFESRRLPKIQK